MQPAVSAEEEVVENTPEGETAHIAYLAVYGNLLPANYREAM